MRELLRAVGEEIYRPVGVARGREVAVRGERHGQGEGGFARVVGCYLLGLLVRAGGGEGRSIIDVDLALVRRDGEIAPVLTEIQRPLLTRFLRFCRQFPTQTPLSFSLLSTVRPYLDLTPKARASTCRSIKTGADVVASELVHFLQRLD